MSGKLNFVIAVLLILTFACSKSMVDQFRNFEQPVSFPAPVYHFNTNPVTQAGFELGRKLFYEMALSRNNTISCGSCHLQASAFTHHGHNISHGIDDRLGSRNSPSITNLAWSSSFLWDGGVFDLDLQPIVPITNPVEMDESLKNVLSKLKQMPGYPPLFRKAFGSDEISTETTMRALSQFMLMMVSDQSKYDQMSRGETTFTPEEQKGYDVFKTNCSSCHQEPLFTDHNFRNNGIGIGANGDAGRYAITLTEADRYKFKVPSLRNLGFTSPYMHDGRFITLEAVIEQYVEGVQLTPNVDPLMHPDGVPGIRMNSTEQSDLISFLRTLNDSSIVKDKRFSEQ